MHRQRGLTLLELLVVLAIIGFAMAGVSLSLRDSRQTQLEREAQRLMAVLEAGRAQSRTSGVALIWQATPDGFVIRPAQSFAAQANTPRTESWLTVGTQAVVGPEPIITPTRITLSAPATQSGQAIPSLSLATDGLRPFQVER